MAENHFPEPISDYLPNLLDPKHTKGSSGKLAIIGGSPDYTGAPFYASYAPLRIGADLTYVYTVPEAATVIKSYSPDLIVLPTLDWDTIKKRIETFDGIVFGPGLGRETETLVPLLRKLIPEVRKRQDSVSLVVDADGLFLVEQDISLIKNCPNIVLTPNHREFDYLWKTVFPNDKPSESDAVGDVRKVAKELGVVVMKKGGADVISDGERIVSCSDQSTPRRCGGQGDLLAGATCLFAFWASKFPDAKACPKTRLLRGAAAASKFIRYTGLTTYEKIGRSMTASDMIKSIGSALSHFDKSGHHL
uniref:ATP-dependent (S)-NAD(P)H-hydrate dehydratase n=1 Tax=Panagrellus redivivus TaxID=6233 RepID=A0A7E4VSE1_PANRE